MLARVAEQETDENQAGAAQPHPTAKAPPPPYAGADTNARWTLRSLATIVAVSFVAWGSGKMACNHHPPRYEYFKVAPLEKMTMRPKDAALEFHHRLNTLDFEGARDLAMDAGLQLVTQRASECDSTCQEERDARQAKVLTRSTLLRREASNATARVESHYGGQVDGATYTVGREGRQWKVSGKSE